MSVRHDSRPLDAHRSECFVPSYGYYGSFVGSFALRLNLHAPGIAGSTVAGISFHAVLFTFPVN